VIELKFRAIICFDHGLAWVPVESKRQWCPVGPDGVLRSKPACVPIHYPIFLLHHFPEKLHEDHFESSVRWTRAYLEFAAGQRDDPPRWTGDPAYPRSK
jgi:hypothetical protein